MPCPARALCSHITLCRSVPMDCYADFACAICAGPCRSAASAVLRWPVPLLCPGAPVRALPVLGSAMQSAGEQCRCGHSGALHSHCAAMACRTLLARAIAPIGLAFHSHRPAKRCYAINAAALPCRSNLRLACAPHMCAINALATHSGPDQCLCSAPAGLAVPGFSGVCQRIACLRRGHAFRGHAKHSLCAAPRSFS